MTHLTLHPDTASKTPRYTVRDGPTAVGIVARPRPRQWRFAAFGTATVIGASSLRQLAVEIRDFYATR